MINWESVVKTPKHSLAIAAYAEFVYKRDVKVDKKLFTDMCKKGCKNFGKKFSCPPFAPVFDDYVKDDLLLVVLFRLDLDQFGHKDFLKVRTGNVVLKFRIEKFMRELESKYGGKFLSTGACRLCRSCACKEKSSCKHPLKMRYAMESLGIDCNVLVEKVFGFSLGWYDGKAPSYTAVVCALPVKDKFNLKELFKK